MNNTFPSLSVSNVPLWDADSIQSQNISKGTWCNWRENHCRGQKFYTTVSISMGIMWRRKSGMIQLQVQQWGMYSAKWWNVYKEQGKNTTMTFRDQKRQTVLGSISHATQTWYSFMAATNTVLMKPREVFSPLQWCSWVHHSSRICYYVTGWLVQHPRRMVNSCLRSYKMPCINFLITASRSRCNELRLAKWIFLIFDTRDLQWHLLTHCNFC